MLERIKGRVAPNTFVHECEKKKKVVEHYFPFSYRKDFSRYRLGGGSRQFFIEFKRQNKKKL